MLEENIFCYKCQRTIVMQITVAVQQQCRPIKDIKSCKQTSFQMNRHKRRSWGSASGFTVEVFSLCILKCLSKKLYTLHPDPTTSRIFIFSCLTHSMCRLTELGHRHTKEKDTSGAVSQVTKIQSSHQGKKCANPGLGLCTDIISFMCGGQDWGEWECVTWHKTAARLNVKKNRMKMLCNFSMKNVYFHAKKFLCQLRTDLLPDCCRMFWCENRGWRQKAPSSVTQTEQGRWDFFVCSVSITTKNNNKKFPSDLTVAFHVCLPHSDYVIY